MSGAYFGPPYPALGATVQAWRRKTRDGLAALSINDRRAYGEAVAQAIRALQQSELRRIAPGRMPRCASGTPHTTGRDIHKAVQQQQRAALLACPSAIRKARPDHKWREMYDAAMRACGRKPQHEANQ